MAKIPYLVRRKNVFYFRLGVPADLREIIKTREIFQSLRTQDRDEAARRALKLAAFQIAFARSQNRQDERSMPT